MNDEFKPLESGTDLLMISKDTFTVDRFKEIATKKLRQNFYTLILHFNEGFWMGELTISMKDTKLVFPRNGIECQLLKIGSQGWQKGKLRIETFLLNNADTHAINVSLEFCPDETLKPKSDLDDIRQSEEYKKLSKND